MTRSRYETAGETYGYAGEIAEPCDAMPVPATSACRPPLRSLPLRRRPTRNCCGGPGPERCSPETVWGRRPHPRNLAEK